MEDKLEVRGHGRAWHNRNTLWAIYYKGQERAFDRSDIAYFTGEDIVTTDRKLNEYNARQYHRHLICEFPSKTKAQRFMEEWMIPTAMMNRMSGKVI